MVPSTTSDLPLKRTERHDHLPLGCTLSSTYLTRDNAFTDLQYRDMLTHLRQRPEEPLAVYVHVPFCHVRCLYCACDTTVTHSLEKVDRYLDALENELAMVTSFIGHGRRIGQLHVGGGTPNHLNEPQLARLMEMVERYFQITVDTCTSIECNPRRSSAGQLELLYGLGFRRISFGVQDLNAEVQRAIGRVQSLDMVRDVFLTARETGFQSINLDLVYGLPFQTRKSFQSTLQQILALNPDQVACFSYAHDPASRPHQHAINTDHLPSAADKLALFHDAVQAFTEAGYRWVGLDVFVRETDGLASAQTEGHLYHNAIGYTPLPIKQVLAFGPGGIGEIDGILVQNESDLQTWQTCLTNHRFPVAWGRRLSDVDQRRREAIMSLMCNLQLPASAAADLEQDYERLCDTARQGLVEVTSDGIRVTPEGRYLLRRLCAEQDAFLELDSWAFQVSVMTKITHQGRIGPNAIIRVAEALESLQSRATMTDLFEYAGLGHYLATMPTDMVDEHEVIALQNALRSQLGIPAARRIARDAGLRTGDYLLAKRIPHPAQRLLSILPPSLACRALIKAIRGNSWTFVGTGIFDADPNYPPKLFVTNSPICRGAAASEPLCDYYVGTFERLFQRLIHQQAVVTEIACQASGDSRCVFEICW